jgi:hypothetical protein
VQQTSDEGYIVAGWTNSFGADSGDVYLIKTDASGDTVWTRTYGGNKKDYGYSVQQTSDGGYVVAGWTNSFGTDSGDVYLIKTDASGDTVWTMTYGGSFNDCGWSVQQTFDEGYIIAGWTNSFGAGSRDVYLIKTDASGDTLWTRTYGGSSTDAGYSVQQTSDSGYIITGQTFSFGVDPYDVYLIKTDASGDTLWTKTYGGSGNDWGFSVQQTSDGGYIITGVTFYLGDYPHDVYLIKTDASGDILWTKTYGGIDDDYGRSVQQTSDGGYIIAGWVWSFDSGIANVYLIKTDASGDTLWTRLYGGTDWDDGQSVQQTSDGGYIIAGATESLGAGLSDVYLIKTDSLGYVGVTEPVTLPAPLDFEIVSTVGSTVTLRYSDLPQGFHAYIYDASGRKADEIQSQGESGIITWGERQPSGVYFIRSVSGNSQTPQRVVLLK